MPPSFLSNQTAKLLTMSRNLGGQKRTIFMPCGKSFVGHPREADKKAMLHRKYCDTCSKGQYTPSPFESNGNDQANIIMSRHGNITKATNKTIHTISDGKHRMVQIDGVATAEQSYTSLKKAVHITDEKDATAPHIAQRLADELNDIDSIGIYRWWLDTKSTVYNDMMRHYITLNTTDNDDRDAILTHLKELLTH